MTMNLEVLKSVLPEGLLDYFDIVDFKELGDVEVKKDCFYIYLDEKNTLHSVENADEYESKGFNNRTLIQDFPIRGKALYLGIRTRRWRMIADKSKEIKNDYTIIAEGSRLTAELSAFLKGTGRDPRRYDK